jgi:hypothetical protein
VRLWQRRFPVLVSGRRALGEVEVEGKTPKRWRLKIESNNNQMSVSFSSTNMYNFSRNSIFYRLNDIDPPTGPKTEPSFGLCIN